MTATETHRTYPEQIDRETFIRGAVVARYGQGIEFRDEETGDKRIGYVIGYGAQGFVSVATDYARFDVLVVDETPEQKHDVLTIDPSDAAWEVHVVDAYLRPAQIEALLTDLMVECPNCGGWTRETEDVDDSDSSVGYNGTVTVCPACKPTRKRRAA